MWKWFQTWAWSRRFHTFLKLGTSLFEFLVLRFDKEGEDGDLTVICWYDSQEEFEAFIRQEYEELGK